MCRKKIIVYCIYLMLLSVPNPQLPSCYELAQWRVNRFRIRSKAQIFVYGGALVEKSNLQIWFLSCDNHILYLSCTQVELFLFVERLSTVLKPCANWMTNIGPGTIVVAYQCFIYRIRPYLTPSQKALSFVVTDMWIPWKHYFLTVQVSSSRNFVEEEQVGPYLPTLGTFHKAHQSAFSGRQEFAIFLDSLAE